MAQDLQGPSDPFQSRSMLTRCNRPTRARLLLLDAEPIAPKHKDTFETPSLQLISRVLPADSVLPIFESGRR